MLQASDNLQAHQTRKVGQLVQWGIDAEEAAGILGIRHATNLNKF